jgi:hypothetical protein
LQAFLRVVLENARFLRGVFVVNCWWTRGESWSIEPSYMEGEKHATVQEFIFLQLLESL